MKTIGWIRATTSAAASLVVAGRADVLHAATYCVDTGAQLQTAMTAAAASAADDAIHRVGGSYASTSSNGFFAQLGVSGDLEITVAGFRAALHATRANAARSMAARSSPAW